MLTVMASPSAQTVTNHSHSSRIKRFFRVNASGRWYEPATGRADTIIALPRHAWWVAGIVQIAAMM